MKHTPRWTVIVLTLVLSGCGGGTVSMSGSDADDEGSLLDQWQRFEDGTPTLRMTNTQVSKAWRSVARKSTHRAVLAGPVSVGNDPGSATPVTWPDFPVGADPCAPGECDFDLPPESTGAFAPVLEHNDVPVAEFRLRATQTLPVPEDRETARHTLLDVLTYGGWLDDTEFRVSVSRWCTVGATGCAGTAPEYENGIAFGFMAGRYSGTTPAGTGSAAWSGVMVGMESPDPGSYKALAVLRSGPDVFIGDARVTIDDLAAPDVDVAFTSVHNVTEGTLHGDMRWENLRVQDGLFGGPTEESGNEFLTGMFTGSRHQEVGGEFRRDGIVGAFGAQRE